MLICARQLINARWITEVAKGKQNRSSGGTTVGVLVGAPIRAGTLMVDSYSCLVGSYPVGNSSVMSQKSKATNKIYAAALYR